MPLIIILLKWIIIFHQQRKRGQWAENFREKSCRFFQTAYFDESNFWESQKVRPFFFLFHKIRIQRVCLMTSQSCDMFQQILLAFKRNTNKKEETKLFSLSFKVQTGIPKETLIKNHIPIFFSSLFLSKSKLLDCQVPTMTWFVSFFPLLCLSVFLFYNIITNFSSANLSPSAFFHVEDS